MENITIKQLTTPEELKKVEELQKKVWGMQDIDVVPTHMLIAATMAGGLVLGAYDENKNLIGFVFGIVGYKNGKIIHHSHMAGVLPEKRYKGLGYLLKLKQREYVLKQGIDLIVWTFDPLRGPNANLNFRKLGVISNTYIRDVYGNLRDNINIGLPSDRFLVEWWIKSKRVEKYLDPDFKKPTLEDILKINPHNAIEVEYKNGIEVVKDIDTNFSSSIVIARIPSDADLLKKKNFRELINWRISTRELFEKLFLKGYIAIDFISIKGSTSHRENYYVFIRNSKEKILEEPNYLNLIK